MDDKDLEIARLQDELEQVKAVRDNYFDEIQKLRCQLFEVADDIYKIYASI
jgi:uncharacterized coiled-coil DUF342 family protein